jgi:hypothetical protein
MPDVAAIIQHGPLPAGGGFVNEPNMIVEDLTITPQREEKRHKGVSRATEALEYTDPTLVFAFQAKISELAGLSDQHPGTAVESLANYSGAIHGFESTQGIMVYKDPSRQMNTEDPRKINFTVEQFPFVVEE